MVEINASRMQIDQKFIDAVNEAYSIDSLADFNSIGKDGIMSMFGIKDLRNKTYQESAPTNEN
ncbi:hypothetical protein D3C71_2189120 [compost metagenome]